MEEMQMVLSSSKSLRTSLRSLYEKRAGLDKHRDGMLKRVPQSNDWAKFDHKFIKDIDLAYLTAATGDEFALLRGKREDTPIPSKADRQTLKKIGQNQSKIISAATGRITTYTSNEFDFIF